MGFLGEEEIKPPGERGECSGPESLDYFTLGETQNILGGKRILNRVDALLA